MFPMTANETEILMAREIARDMVEGFYQAGDEVPDRETLRVQQSGAAGEMLVDEIVAGRWLRSWVVTAVDLIDGRGVAQGVGFRVRQVAVPSWSLDR